MEIDYKALGLRVGLEIHQQLDTKHKLFCSCPTSLSNDNTPETTITRYLRVAKSEVGEIDPAALYEMKKGRRIIYHVPQGHACMVETDEEPPHDLNREAVIITLAVAKALHSTPVDEIYVMRKIVIDGSNTTGFQRTAIVALGGYVDDEEGRVGIQTICLEEDAARKVSEGPGYVEYNLDRLGIPLIEISTSPDIHSPEQAMRVALKIGMLLRLTGKVKRGLGTIRQDLNISISGGVKTEVKGVSKLELIPKIVEYEVMRQLRLLEIKEELIKRGVREEELTYEFIDVTEILKDVKTRFIQRAIKRGARALAVRLKGFGGLLGMEVQPSRRFGTELSDYAKAWGGVGGIIHSDELPAYGISEELKDKLFKVLGLDPQRDAYAIVIADKEKCERALRALVDRARHALKGIPPETRGANPDGTTRYLRPQPGAARMYPETDVPPLRLTTDILKEAEKLKPKTPEEVLEELIKVHGLSKELAHQLIRDPAFTTYLDLLKELHGRVHPQIIASTLLIHLKALKSEGLDVSKVSFKDLVTVLSKVGEGYIAKEAIPEVLAEYLSSGSPIEEILRRYGSLSDEELLRIINEVINDNAQTVCARGTRAFGLVMGKVMSKVRGRVDGSKVAQLVKESLTRYIGEHCGNNVTA